MLYTVFLQNAWSRTYAGRRWPRTAWLRALQGARSGQRLRLLIDDFAVCYNTTLDVGPTPESRLPPSPDYIRAILRRCRPEVVVACGRQAEAALVELFDGPLLAVPHPASRVLTDDLYRRARALLTPAYSGRYALRQRRGYVDIVTLARSNP
jgi:hypothetical protein